MSLKALGVAWFRKEDWPRWRAIDPDFEPDYDRWLRKAEAEVKKTREFGIRDREGLYRPRRIYPMVPRQPAKRR